MDKLAKIKKLADAMYYAAMYLTTDASRLHKAMDKYHQFIIQEYKEKPVEENVDFEKELDRIWFDNKLGDYFDNDALDFAHIRTLCKHFFELGLSVSNSTKVTIPDIDDVLKENGVNPDSKEAKIIKESYFMAIEKLTQKGEEL